MHDVSKGVTIMTGVILSYLMSDTGYFHITPVEFVSVFCT